MRTFTFNSEILLKSVHLYYLDAELKPIVHQLNSVDNKVWSIALSQKLNIKYYVYIINETFWICDYTKNTVIVNNYWYSDINSNLILQKDNPTIKNAVFCRDFSIDSYLPINITKIFTNSDQIIGFWAKLNNVRNDSIIYFQLFNPNDELVAMVHEKLKVNQINNFENTFYFGYQISPITERGTWRAKILINNQSIIETQCIYKLIINNYTNTLLFKNVLIKSYN